MRKLAAILLMLILLFNLCGYRIAISLLQKEADQQLETRIDNKDYQESQLIEIKVALNNPYQQRYTEFERHYGEIEIEGAVYTYVMKKIDGDVVIFKCIANESKQQLRSISNYWTQSNAIATNGNSKQHHPAFFEKNPLVEFEQQQLASQLLPVSEMQSRFSGHASPGIPSISLHTPDQPPETIAYFS